MFDVVKGKFFHVVVLLITLVPVSASAESWLCVTEAATGFIRENPEGPLVGRGAGTVRNYLIRPPLEGEDVVNSIGASPTFAVVEVGKSEPLAFFYYDLGSGQLYWYRTDVGKLDVAFSPESGRYLMSSYFDFMGAVEFEFMPYMELGNCSQLD